VRLRQSRVVSRMGDPVASADIASAEFIEVIIQDAATSKVVIEGSDLARAYVCGLLRVPPVLYKAGTRTARGFSARRRAPRGVRLESDGRPAPDRAPEQVPFASPRPNPGAIHPTN
jgi:hypothetical protein